MNLNLNKKIFVPFFNPKKYLKFKSKKNYYQRNTQQKRVETLLNVNKRVSKEKDVK